MAAPAAFPFFLQNFAYGLSEVSWRGYSSGLVAILPGTILFCGLGALAGDVARFREVLSPAKPIPSPRPCASWDCWPPCWWCGWWVGRRGRRWTLPVTHDFGP